MPRDIVQRVILDMKPKDFELGKKGLKDLDNTLRKLSKDTQLPLSRISGAMEKAGISMKKTTEGYTSFYDVGTQKATTYDKAMRKMKMTTKEFKMEYLGLMFFFGMGVSMIFGQHTQRLRQMTGQTEIWSATMTQTMLPTQMMATKTTMQASQAIIGLNNATGGLVGGLFYAVDVIGKLGFAFYQTKLGLESMKQVSGSVGRYLRNPLGLSMNKLRDSVKWTTLRFKKLIIEMFKTKKAMAMMNFPLIGLALGGLAYLKYALKGTTTALIRFYTVALLPILVPLGAFVIANAAIIAGLSLLIGTLAIVHKNWDLLKDIVGSTAEWFSEKLGGMWSTAVEVMDNIATTIQNSKIYEYMKVVVDGVVTLWEGITATIGGIFEGIVDSIVGFINPLIESINMVIGKVNEVFDKDYGEIPLLKTAAESKMAAIQYATPMFGTSFAGESRAGETTNNYGSGGMSINIYGNIDAEGIFRLQNELGVHRGYAYDPTSGSGT